MEEREHFLNSRRPDDFVRISLDSNHENVTLPTSTNTPQHVPRFDPNNTAGRSSVSRAHPTKPQTRVSNYALNDDENTSENGQNQHSPLLGIAAVGRENDPHGQHDSTLALHSRSSSDKTPQQKFEMVNGSDTWVNQPRWTPFYLRAPFLFGQAFVFALMIAALEALYYVSERDKGLTTTSQNLHYLWTYGPTFVLTILAAFWAQVEYRTKQLMPWALMSLGKSSTKHPLLLNYLMSTNPESLLRSIKRRHFPVSIGISGSLLLRLLIVFSTGLFGLEYRPITHDKEIIVLDSLDLGKQVDVVTGTPQQPVDTALYFWGTRAHDLPLPRGVTSEFAVQTFKLSEGGSYDTVAADVQVFQSRLENCETFDFEYSFSNSPPDNDTALESVLPDRYEDMFKQWCFSSRKSVFGAFNPTAESLAAQGTFFFLKSQLGILYECSNETFVERPGLEHRLLIGLETGYPEKSRRISGALCEPTYSLTRRTVTNVTDVSRSEDLLRVPTTAKEILDLGKPPSNITQDILDSIQYELSTYNTAITGIFDRYQWYNLLNLTEPRRTMSDWANTTLITELSQKVWTAFAAFSVRMELVSPSNQTLQGTATSTKSRLCIQELSLRLMEALLALLALLSIALYLLFPGVLYRDPGPVGSHALILAKSPPLRNILAGGGLTPTETLDSRLRGYTASFPTPRTANDPTVVVTPTTRDTSDDSTPSQPTKDNTDQSKWWQPLTGSTWFRIALFATTVAVIVVLEVLSQISKKNHGIANVVIDGYQKYTWTYIPTVIMALIGLTFAAADATARLLHPFQLLRRGNASFKEMLYDPASQLTLAAVVHATRKRHIALLASMLTALMAPALTIVTSGLYTPTPVPWSHDIALDVTGWFHIGDGKVRDVSLGGDYDFLSLIEYTNMTYPQWTHGAYAFSTFNPATIHGTNGNDTALTLHAARFPATRANMNCTMTHYFPHLNDSARTQDILVDPPAGCHPPPATTSSSSTSSSDSDSNNGTDRQLRFSLATPPTTIDADGYFVNDLTEYGMLYSSGIASEDLIPAAVCGDDRSHFWYLSGHRRDNGTHDSLSLLHCTPYIEALVVGANFSMPGVEVLGEGDEAVVADEDSAVFMSAAPNATARPWNDVGQFLSLLVNGTGGMPLREFVGRENVDGFRGRVEELYGIYIAQVLHTYYRRSTDDVGDAGDDGAGDDGAAAQFAAGPINGTVVDGARLRLVQNAVSTRILEGLLAAMLVCGAVACVLEGKTRILPKDPGSIAAKMSLFADGEVWWDREVVDELREEERGERRREELFKGWAFRMGWWDEGEEGAGGGNAEAGKRRFGVDATRVYVDNGSSGV